MSLFITLEGPDGSGKSSQAKLLADYLRGKNLDILLTREPGGTAISDQIRSVLTNLENTSMDGRTEFLLFSASRAQHVREVIQPHLENGGVVVSDRFFDSSIAYQGYGQKLELAMLREITLFATGGLVPDLTLLLDLPCDVGLDRRKNDGSWNRLDAYDLEFHSRVRDGYLELAAEEPSRWVIIDALASPEIVQNQIRHAVDERLP